MIDMEGVQTLTTNEEVLQTHPTRPVLNNLPMVHHQPHTVVNNNTTMYQQWDETTMLVRPLYHKST